MKVTVEFLAPIRLGEKGQVTIPKQYRDALKLEVGASIAALRIGDGLGLPRHRITGRAVRSVRGERGRACATACRRTDRGLPSR